MNPDTITAEQAIKCFEESQIADAPLGTLEDGSQIFAKRGRYGPYIQVINGKERRNIALTKNTSLEDITLEEATFIASLPRVLGKHPEDNEDITLQYGRYGAYVKWNNNSRSIGNEPLSTIDKEKALQLLAMPKKSRKRKK